MGQFVGDDISDERFRPAAERLLEHDSTGAAIAAGQANRDVGDLSGFVVGEHEIRIK